MNETEEEEGILEYDSPSSDEDSELEDLLSSNRVQQSPSVLDSPKNECAVMAPEG